jgi:trehalose synthase
VPGPLTAVEVGSLPLERFDPVIDADQRAAIRHGLAQARRLFAGRSIWNVNSTARGGGVAELLVTLLAYARGAGVDARWRVISGDDAFFQLTKRIHHRLHGYPGDGGPLGPEEHSIYETALEPNAEALRQVVAGDDVVILHDPQTAGLVPALRDLGVPVIWRCHVGADSPNGLAREAWAFLEPFVTQADVVVFSRRAFAWDVVDPGRQVIITPSIDAFSPKNQELAAATAEAILTVAGLRAGEPDGPASFTRMTGRPDVVRRSAEVIQERPMERGDRYVLEVSRWDELKDPLGVIAGFAEHVAPYEDVHLVYAGPAVAAVTDDPEGARVLARARELRAGLAPAVRERVHLAVLPMDDLEENAAIVNALQRRATVVVQKSLAEGFGLTVAEAMWKARPVVASRIGGIQEQIEHGRSGLLLDDPTDLAAYGAAVRELLGDEQRADAMGMAGRERVREDFLGTRSLLAYLALLQRLL